MSEENLGADPDVLNDFMNEVKQPIESNLDTQIVETKVTENEELGDHADDEPKVEVQKPKPDDIVDDYESEARKMGWDPAKGELSAKEFVERAPLYKSIRQLTRDNQTIRDSLIIQQKFMEEERKRGYQQALQDLERKRNEAIYAGNVEEVNHLDKEIQSTQRDLNSVPITEIPELAEFKEKYNDVINGQDFESKKVVKFMQELDQELTQYNLSPKEHLKQIEKQMHKEFPDYFKKSEPSKRVVPDVEPPTASHSAEASSNSKNLTWNDLTPAEKRVCREFVNNGLMTESEFIRDLRKVRKANKEF